MVKLLDLLLPGMGLINPGLLVVSACLGSFALGICLHNLPIGFLRNGLVGLRLSRSPGSCPPCFDRLGWFFRCRLYCRGIHGIADIAKPVLDLQGGDCPGLGVIPYGLDGE